MAKKPDYTLSYFITDTQEKGNNIGAGWNNDDGSIGISLNALVSIPAHPNLRLRLWPVKQEAPTIQQPYVGEHGETVMPPNPWRNKKRDNDDNF